MEKAKSLFDRLSAIDCHEHIEVVKTQGKEYNYLSWAWAWIQMKKNCPDASYDVCTHPQTMMPYFEAPSGAFVYTSVTAEGQTMKMWMPILDTRNNAMKSEPYAYTTASGKQVTVQAFTSFDVNKSIMRCLAKNIAMFGLGMYLYAGEDIPESTKEELKNAEDELVKQVNACINDVQVVKLWNDHPEFQVAGSKFYKAVGDMRAKFATK